MRGVVRAGAGRGWLCARERGVEEGFEVSLEEGFRCGVCGVGGGAEDAGVGLGVFGVEEDVEDAVDGECGGEPAGEECGEGVGVGRAEGDGGLVCELVVVEPPDVGADDGGERRGGGEGVLDVFEEGVSEWSVDGLCEERGAGHDEECAVGEGGFGVVDEVCDGGALRLGSESRRR